jgi:predicted ATPase
VEHCSAAPHPGTYTVEVTVVGRLVGRTAELSQLEDALAEARKGRGCLALLAGEPGIGKTRLAEAFSSEATGAGVRVAWGRAWEAGGAPAFWPWIEVLRELLDDAAEEAAAATGDSLSILSELVPELRDRIDGLAPAPQLDAGPARFRLFDAVAKLLRWAARSAPIGVVLDDLHAADAATLSLLRFVARSVRSARVLLLGTFRDSETGLAPEVAEELTHITREGRYVHLSRLARSDVADWLEGADSQLAEALYERTEGNPLFLVETYRLIRSGRWSPASPISTVADGVREVIAKRLRALPDGVRSLLAIAGVHGRSFETEVVAAVCGLSSADALEELEKAVRTDVIAWSSSGRCSFTHVLIRDVIYAELAAAERAQLHQAIADVLIARSEHDPHASLSDIAHHLFAAVTRSGAHTAIAWARRAAQRASARLAFEESIRLLERCLEALPREVDRDPERADILLELAQARIRSGLGARGREAASEAAEIARCLRDSGRLARAALTYGDLFTFAVIDPLLVELLGEALAALTPNEVELRARLLARLASAQQPAVDPAAPMAIAREAIAMARALTTPTAHISVLDSAISGLLYFADPDERAPLNREVIELADRLDDRVRALRGRLRLVTDHVESGRIVDADATIEEYARLAQTVGHPAYLWYAPLLRAMRAAMTGRFEEALELGREAKAIAARTEDPNCNIAFTFHHLGLLRVWADNDALGAYATKALERVGSIDYPWFGGALAVSTLARLGRLSDLTRELARYPSDATGGTGRMSLAWFAEACIAAERHDLAASVYPLLLPLGHRQLTWGVTTFVCEGPIARQLGLLAAMLGRWTEAERHFDDALERVAALHAPPLRARVEFECAVALVRRGDGAAAERAARLLESAEHTGNALGMPALRDAARALFGHIVFASAPPRCRQTPQHSQAPPPPQSGPAFSFAREGDHWTIRCEDRTFHLVDSRGLQILAQLVGHPDRAFHVTDLMAPKGERGLVTDAGEVLDEEAIGAYRRRLDQLEGELAEADSWNDSARSERLREELEILTQELGRALGVGGRRRRAHATSEKARINVRRRLTHAITKIAEHDPALGRHLSWAVKTGQFCVYRVTGR